MLIKEEDLIFYQLNQKTTYRIKQIILNILQIVNQLTYKRNLVIFLQFVVAYYLIQFIDDIYRKISNENDLDSKHIFSFSGFIQKIRQTNPRGDPQNIYYLACSNDGCKKKVLEEGYNTYRCEKCNQAVDKPKA